MDYQDAPASHAKLEEHLRVEELARRRCRFAYETRNADGNPSYVKWAWEVVGAGHGTKITVTWDCYLKMLDRRVLGGPLQKRQAARVGTDEPPVTAA